ncbi:MAG TPA: hypothetical protein VJ816_04980 [Gemmatimonadales bacterium]|nr:hypothetical protein [Gemmatimonadales bacterium]
MQSRSSLWLLCSGAVALGACSKKPTPAAQAAPTVITVSAMDFAFAAPETVPAGLVTFQLVGTGKEPHQMVVMRIDSGKTMADVQPVLSSTNMAIPGWLKFPIGVSVIAPGDTGNATALLTPGHYAMACFVPSPDGTAHVAKGMMRTFEVAPNEATPAPEPTADITITEKDYDFDVTGALTAGTHTIRVENAGPQLHEVAMSQLAPGKSLADFQAWVQGGMKGEPPGKPVGGVTGPDVGGHQTFTATLAAGKYVLMCLVPDNKDGQPHIMHGMIKEITIS